MRGSKGNDFVIIAEIKELFGANLNLTHQSKVSDINCAAALLEPTQNF